VRALSLRQPWAWGVAGAGKRLENRRWKWLSKGFAALPDGGPIAGAVIAIHASRTRPKHLDVEAVKRCAGVIKLPAEATLLGAVVATARIVDVLRAVEPFEQIGGDPAWPLYRMRPDDLVRYVDRCGALAGEQVARWWLGPFAFVLEDVMPLENPVPACGALGFWNLPPEVARDVCAEADRCTRVAAYERAISERGLDQ
jgi:hypothetical protein